MWPINNRSKIIDKKTKFSTEKPLEQLEIKNNSRTTSTSIYLQQNG